MYSKTFHRLIVVELFHLFVDCFILFMLCTLTFNFSICSHVGQSRSAAVVTAYLMKTQSLSLHDAYTKLQNLKPDVK